MARERGFAPPISLFLEKRNGPCTVQRENAWCPNPAWRQVRAKTGVLARKRRIFAVWSPRWARAQVCGNPKCSARDETRERIVVLVELAPLLFSLPLRGWLTTASWRTISLPSPGMKSRIGESGAAPPVAEQASRFRGIRRSTASGRKSEADSRMGPGRRVLCTCRLAGPTVSKSGTIGGPARGRESYCRNGGPESKSPSNVSL